MKDKTVIEALAEVYPQLYLDPNRVDKETYRSVVLAGEMPEIRSLAHFRQSPQDSSETVETPAGRVQVVSIRDRGDYERLVRCMMAAKEGPLAPVPATQGASTLTVFNWPRIRAHQEKFLAEQRAAGNPDPDWSKEFQCFLSVKENYIDMLVVLSWGPYSAVPAEKAGWPEDSWLETSLAIRKYHELTHVICRRQYPDRVEAVWDELVADAIGIYGALGRFDPALEKLFLGIAGDRYAGGRLENYTDSAAQLAGMVSRTLEGFAQLFADHPGAEPFAMIPLLQERQRGWKERP